MKNIKSKYKKAFTLAEILITLTIIGIVASLTIPSLINNIGDQQNRVAWKKAYADLSQATMKVVADNGGSFAGLCPDDANKDNCYMDKYLPYLNYIKSCNFGGANTGNCWHASGVIKYSDNNTLVPDWWASQPSIILNNGSSILFVPDSPICQSHYGSLNTCGWIAVDVNGFKGPNIINKDIFSAWILADSMKPFGTQGDLRICGSGGSIATGCAATFLYQ